MNSRSDPYSDPELATLYDLDNPDGPDHAFYRALADTLDARTIVDLGCGTGLLPRSLHASGRTAMGVDPSPTTLKYVAGALRTGGVFSFESQNPAARE